jgi:hypothetical protein
MFILTGDKLNAVPCTEDNAQWQFTYFANLPYAWDIKQEK